MLVKRVILWHLHFVLSANLLYLITRSFLPTVSN